MKTKTLHKFLILLGVIQLSLGLSVTTEESETLESSSTFTSNGETTTNEPVAETTTDSIDTNYSTTSLSITLELYAVQQMNSVLNHLVKTSYEFVTEVLQETQPNSIYPRDKLKTYAEHLLRMLQEDEETLADAGIEVSYNMMVKKLLFLKGKTTRQLQTFLPKDWVENYLKIREDVSVWLDQSAEQMRSEFNAYVSDEDDHVKYQYFNEAFDDIPRANEIHQKLTILHDLVKIATNKKQITFMDLYMQS